MIVADVVVERVSDPVSVDYNGLFALLHFDVAYRDGCIDPPSVCIV
ncbi:MAG: hypothetical protein ACR2PF_06515 [Rhizobiaceae bacterium]